MSGQINRISRFRLQFFQKFGRLFFLLLFVLDYNANQNETSTPAQNITYSEAVASPLQIFLRNINPCSVRNSKVIVNYPSSLLSGDGVFSLAVDTRLFASLSRAVGGMLK